MKLSVVTVCFNAEKFIEETILSVLGQSMPVYEYILIDGASTDSSYQIIQSYKEEFTRKGIIYKYISEKDRGISDAFNKGIRWATGDLVGIINADDELLPDTCKILTKIYGENDADVYYGDAVWVEKERGFEYISKPNHDLKRLLYYMVLIHPSTFVKRKVYQECGLFDVTYKYCMDKEILYRFYKMRKRFFYVDKCLTRFKAGGVTDTHAKNVFKEGSRMALSYGEPKIKVLTIQYWKMFRENGVRFMKKSPVIYKLLKSIRLYIKIMA